MPINKLDTSTNASNHTKKRLAHKKKITFEDDTSNFPSDILRNILAGLPAKSLLRFKCVSQPWNAVITDDDEFKKAQRDQSKALGREKLLLQRNSNIFEFRDLENSQLVMMENQRFPLKRFQRAEVLCSCDGLVLLKNPCAYKNFILWNPSTGEYRALSCPDNHLYKNINQPRPRALFATGLGYDSSVGDYKVILFYDGFYDIYSLVNDCWTKKTSFPYGEVVSIRPNFNAIYGGISIEGCVFWSMNGGEMGLFVNNGSTIIYFDVTSNEVRNLPMPNLDEEDIFSLASVKGRLSLYGGRMERNELNIWILQQDGSWKWLLNMCNLPFICKRFVQERVLLCCTRNGEILFQGWLCFRLFIYNPSQNLLREIEIPRDDPNNMDSPLASVCLDSLYSPSLSIKRKRKRCVIEVTEL